MTNKELAEFNRSLIGGCTEHDEAHAQTASILESLVPRTEPPTVEELSDEGLAIHWMNGGVNPAMLEGGDVRDLWSDGDRWLPLSKIEEGA